MKILHHHHKAEIGPNRPSTLTKVEVEVVVQAKDKVVAVVTKTKASNKISLMMDKCPMYVEEEIKEARGFKEVAKVSSKTMQEMIAENAGIVVEQVITNECPSRSQGDRRQQGNYASTSRNTDDLDRLFVMQHMINSVSRNVSKCSENVWYVDSGASNHMTIHGEWFEEL